MTYIYFIVNVQRNNTAEKVSSFLKQSKKGKKVSIKIRTQGASHRKTVRQRCNHNTGWNYGKDWCSVYCIEHQLYFKLLCRVKSTTDFKSEKLPNINKGKTINKPLKMQNTTISHFVVKMRCGMLCTHLRKSP